MKTKIRLITIGLISLMLILLSACSKTSKLNIETIRTTDTGLAILSGSEKPGDFEALMLAKINYLRKKGYVCQDITFEASDDLTWNMKLSGAAKSHVKDLLSMHSEGTIDIRKSSPPHIGSDGNYVATRAENQEYSFDSIAENLASTPNASMAMHATYLSWLASTEGHCEVLVRSDFSEIGLYYEDGIWAAVFGSPKQ